MDSQVWQQHPYPMSHLVGPASRWPSSRYFFLSLLYPSLHMRIHLSDTSESIPATSSLRMRPPLETICPLCITESHSSRSVCPSRAWHRDGLCVHPSPHSPQGSECLCFSPHPIKSSHRVRFPAHPLPQPHPLGSSLLMHTPPAATLVLWLLLFFLQAHRDHLRGHMSTPGAGTPCSLSSGLFILSPTFLGKTAT